MQLIVYINNLSDNFYNINKIVWLVILYITILDIFKECKKVKKQ